MVQKNEDFDAEVYENDIDLWLDQFKQEQNIDDFKTAPQSVWNGALKYVHRHLIKPNPGILRQRKTTTAGGSFIPSNYNAYDYDIVLQVLDYYIYLCQIYSKEISIVGFSNLTGIDTDTINEWGNENIKLSSTSAVIYKKLVKMREESLSNKLADGKQNPVGVIAMLNRHYGWASPYTADANRQKVALSASDLPRLGEKTGLLPLAESTENVANADK